MKLKKEKNVGLSFGRLSRSLMVAVLLVNYLPITGLSGTDKIEAVTGTAAAPVIKKGLDHTSLYIQSDAIYHRGLREYVTAASPDGGVLSYAWFINTSDAYLDGTDNVTSGTWGDNGKDANGDGNTGYQGSYGTQAASSNILIATTPTTVGTYYVYVEITNTTSGGASTTVRSKRAKLDVRANLYNRKTDGTNPSGNNVIPDYYIFPPRDNNVSLRTAKPYLDTTLFYMSLQNQEYIATNNVLSSRYQFDIGVQRGYDMYAVGNSSKVEDISTVPGKIYEFSFIHTSCNQETSGPAVEKDFLGFTVAKSKLEESDYSPTILNRYWDGTDNISADDDKDNGNQTFKFDTTYMSSGGSTNYGVYPYGMNPGAQGTNSTTKAPHFMPDIWGQEFGTDYFFDIARSILFPDTFDYTKKPAGQSAYDWQKSFYDAAGVTPGVTSPSVSNLSGSSDVPVNSNFLARINALNKTNQFTAATYGGDPVQLFLSNDGTVQPGRTDGSISKKSGYVTIPETQGATVLAFTSLSADNTVSDNGLDQVVFQPIAKPTISETQTYAGNNSLTVSGTKADYAYALVDVSQGYAQYVANVGSYTTDATIDTSLGEGDNWFTTSNASITFDNLGVGRTYRIIAIPQAAIQVETNSNVTPLDVLDTDAWVDTTIAVPAVEGHILSGAYHDGGINKGRVRIRQANLGNYYALLAVGSTGKPITTSAVGDWVTPDANGEVVFENLALQTGDNPYVVIAKPQSFFTFDYAKATYSPTETYQAGDNIPSGFSEGDPVMIATPVTITNAVTNLALGKSEITRSLGRVDDEDNDAGTDTITITYDATYRGGGLAFPANTTAIAFDKTRGTVAGLKGSVDVSSQSTATFSVPTDGDYDVILQFGAHYDLPIVALAAPDPLVIDYVNENLLINGLSGAAGYNTQGNVDYRLESGGNYYLGTSATTVVQGSNTQPISLTPALDDTAHPYQAEGTLSYTKHMADTTRTIGVQRILAVPHRDLARSCSTDLYGNDSRDHGMDGYRRRVQ
ncbi:hypothetical protein FACS1894193_01990 [Bacilli bacterium]|nr:hypothetical protein FACS1894192_06720 [Bacilli bacterium]GHU40163.1 hypothetical protein FACS1894193_01990 [Bacilli bacterium]